MEPTTKQWKTDKLKNKKTDSSEVSVNSPRGIRAVSPEEEKEGYGGNDLQKRKVSSAASQPDNGVGRRQFLPRDAMS